MWGQSEAVAAGFGGGGAGAGRGFLPGASTTVAVAADNQTKTRRSQNIFPCTVKQLLTCQEESLQIEGTEAHVITIVGLVRAVKTTTTKFSMYIDDQTGTIECVSYIGSDGETGDGPTILCEKTYGRIVGGLRRSTKGERYVIIFRSEPLTDLNELTSHLLEVVQTKMNLKKLRAVEDKKPAGGGGALDNTFNNSMIARGGAGLGAPAGEFQTFTAKQKIVLGVILSTQDVSGMHRDQIIATLKNRMQIGEIMAVIEFLSNEGHIFNTIDDDHFKCTDSQ